MKEVHKHKGDRDRRDDFTPSLSRPKKAENKFIKVNCCNETISKEFGMNVLGTPSIMKTNNLENRKASNKWFTFYEDYEHLIEDCISLKVWVDNQI